MFYLIIELLNTDYKEDIFLALQSVGIGNASYMDSYNLKNYLSAETSLFKGFFKSDIRSDSEREEEGLICTLAESKDQVRELLKNLKDADIDIEGENILRVFLLPLVLAFDSQKGLSDFK